MATSRRAVFAPTAFDAGQIARSSRGGEACAG